MCAVATALAALLGGACVSSEDAFVDGRLERLCGQAIPACGVQASCVLDERGYVEGAFPGGLRLLVQTDGEAASLRVRIYMTTMSFPGTELLVQANTPDCAELDEVHLVDEDDIFAVAGDDRIFDWTLELPGRGDHLLELFSDMSGDYLLTVDILDP